MKVCIIGCGAIGSIYGAHLALDSDVEVWAYDVETNHVDAINQHGLRLTGRRDFVAKINATTEPQDIPPCDYGIIATKTYHTQAAIAATAHIFSNGIVCSLQNGVGNEEIIAGHVKNVITGTAFPGGHITSPGFVEFDTDGKSSLGPFADTVSLDGVSRLGAALTENGLETVVLEDPRGAKWTKLIFNAAANPLCAISKLPFGKIYSLPEMRKLMYGIAEEGIAVAKALDIVLDVNPVEQLDKASRTATAHVPSMMSDIQNKRTTEVDALNGGIVSYGNKVGIPCPLNEAMIALIKSLESHWQA